MSKQVTGTSPTFSTPTQPTKPTQPTTTKVTIRKRNGTAQEFNREKIINSVRKTGATEETARRVAEKIPSVEGMTTAQIRERVQAELRPLNAPAATAFESYRKPA